MVLGRDEASLRAEEWFEALKDRDACVTPVRTLAEVSAEFAGALPRLPDLSVVEGILR